MKSNLTNPKTTNCVVILQNLNPETTYSVRITIMSKQRKKIPKQTEITLLDICDHTCCVCRESQEIQIHHINKDSQDNNIENLAVLCLNCHDKAEKTGGLSRNFSPEYITKRREEWIAICEERKEKHVKRKNEKDNKKPANLEPQDIFSQGQPLTTLQIAIINSLPKIKAGLLVKRNKQLSEAVTMSTIDMVNAYTAYNESLKSILIMVADFCDPRHFEDQSPKEFFEEIISTRRRFFSLISHHHPDSPYMWGRMHREIYHTLCGEDINNLIENLISTFLLENDFDYKHWKKSWRNANRLEYRD